MRTNQKRIILGYPLDLLFNRTCKYETYEENFIKKDFFKINQTELGLNPGSIVLPYSGTPGTGNIIIRGKPGTAKSTLALQIAVAATQENLNNCISFYVTLEEQPEHIYYKSKLFGWDSYCSVFSQLCGIEKSASVDEYRNYLIRAITQKDDCQFKDINSKSDKCSGHNPINPIKPHVYISTFSPRDLFISDSEESKDLFWDRYSQLERLLAAAQSYNNNKGNNEPEISFICIDSINVFGDNLLSRTDLFRLFDLFKRFEIIGIIIVEEDERYIYHNEGKLHGETIEYLGDVIISLTSEEDQNYSLRYMEITKSRYQHQVYGKHPFKIAEAALTYDQQKDFFTKKLTVGFELKESELGRTWRIPDNYIPERIPENFSVCIDDFKLESSNHISGNEKCDLRFIYNDEKIEIDKSDNYENINRPVIKFKKDTKQSVWKVEEITTHVAASPDDVVLFKNIDLDPVYAIKAFPSLHYIVFGSDLPKKTGNKRTQVEDLFFEKNISTYLSKSFELPGVIVIEGPYATFKTTIAKDFLLRGLVQDTHDYSRQFHSILIRFADESSIDQNVKFRLSKNVVDKYQIMDKVGVNKLFGNFIERDFNENTKRILKTYKIDYLLEPKSGKAIPPLLFRGFYTEVIFKSGHILPEEFIQILLDVFNSYKGEEFESYKKILPPGEFPLNNQKKQIRIVFDEIGRIGTSYPLLLKSKSSGELFLTAVLHILKNYEANVILTGTTNEFEKATQVIDQTKTLADTVLSTRNVNVFGDKYIMLKGEGLITQRSSNDSKENVPGVILPVINLENISSYEVNKDYFNGLVGFDSNNIHRPGIAIYVFEENDHIHKFYNANLSHMLEVAFNTNESLIINEQLKTKDIGIIPQLKTKDIGIIPFNGAQSPSYHEALNLSQGNPLDKTILFTIDEFYRTSHKDFFNVFHPIDYNAIQDDFDIDESFFKSCTVGKENKNEIYSFPFWDNFLFLAVNTEKIRSAQDKDFYKNFTSWSKIETLINNNINRKNNELIDVCILTTETFSCILLDILLKCSKIEKDESGKINLDDVFKSLKDDEKKAEFKNELFSLSRLFNTSVKIRREFLDRREESDGDYKGTKKHQLIPNASIYVCWYSELRELLYRRPKLSDKLEIFPLPGKGFKGDWQIGILNGSVSASLGLKVIKKLCNKNEDFKRFAFGVGMPTSARFLNNNDFLAWPNSNLNISSKERENEPSAQQLFEDSVQSQLDYLYYLHKNANERANITGYQKYKEVLVSLFKELVMIEGSFRKSKADQIKKEERIESLIIMRLEKLFEILK